MTTLRARPKVGLITIGQSPRVDMVPEMLPLLGDVEPLERGALDGLTAEEILHLRPGPGDYTLITRLRDGSSAVIAERHILPRMQAAIDEMEAAGVDAIVLVCTGEFPPFRHTVPLLTAERLIVGGVRAIAAGSRLGVICPLVAQVQLTYEKWSSVTSDLHVEAGSPYGDLSDLREAARRLRETAVEYVVLDCMGYTKAMKDLVRAEVRVPVLLARSIVARLAAEVLA
ncbi:MAG TPA: AroM family protein [Symbiobacteriaceae bacterium]